MEDRNAANRIDIIEIGKDWIDLAQNRDCWRSPEGLSLPRNDGDVCEGMLLTLLQGNSFSRPLSVGHTVIEL